MRFKIFIQCFLFFNLYGNVVNLVRINSNVVKFGGEDTLVLMLQAFITTLGIIAFLLGITQKNGIAKTSKKILSFFAIVLFFNIFGSIVGFFNGYSSKILPDFITFLIGPLIALSISSLSLTQKTLEKLNQTLSRFLLIVFFLSFLVVYTELSLGLRIYPALNPTIFAFVIPFYYYRKKIKYWVASSLLLVLGLKRSILMAFLFTLFPFLAIKRKQVLRKALVLSVVASGLSVITIFYTFSLLENSDSIASATVNKFATINPFSERFDFSLGSGERVEEITQSIDALENVDLGLILGGGNGFTYLLRIDRKEYQEDEHHNVHFSPVLYITRYGIIVTILFYGLIIHLIGIGFRRYRDTVAMYPWLFYAIFGLFSSFFSFSFSSDILFWTSIGVLFNTSFYSEYINKKLCVE